jgi:flagellar hook-associated protein 3 FlgL
MDRISTASAYSSVLNNLLTAQVAQTKAGQQLSSSEASTNLAGYGTQAETLTAMQATQTQITGYLNNTQFLSAKLSTQDSALNQVASSAGDAIQAITQALAHSDGTTLMSTLDNAFGQAVEGLNSQFNGEYLFAGGQVNTQPVSATSISSLAPGGPLPPINSFFNNDQRVSTSQLDQNTSISTGFLANAIGAPLFGVFQAIQDFANTNGPFNGTLTSAQQAFLTSQISALNTVQSNLNNIVGQNGLAENQVTAAQTSLTQRQTLLQGLIGNITQADVAQATTNLQQAQLSIQAAGQVFQALNSSTLLNSLSAPGPIG